jgi:hypothetical protein
VPAREIERLVEDRVTHFLADRSALFDVLEPVFTDTAERMRYIEAAGELAKRWGKLEPAVKRTWLAGLIHRIDLGIEALSISIDPSRLSITMQDGNGSPALDMHDAEIPGPDIETKDLFTLTIPARLKRAGMEMRLLIDGAGGGARTKSDRSLCRLLAQAYRFQSLLLKSRGKTMTEVAAEAGVAYSYFRRILTVGLLAPDIAQAILRNRHPVELNARQLSQKMILPLSWGEQRSLLGLE